MFARKLVCLPPLVVLLHQNCCHPHRPAYDPPSPSSGHAAAMLMSIVFAPFALAALRCAWLALDGGITLEPYSPEAASLSLEVWGLTGGTRDWDEFISK